ncbi:hypothetical protein SAMN05518846_106152 [Brevibacillus centrosporus]|uniref:Uncharacterized protein n=1 Tax=Brevibacillus centrosporus TaxID=54910 RepID=A0A1I3V0W1_9BACL|nr:hypothetical protein SAMN05518846_106152 [Brevibacillus centrosporus]
MLEQSWQIDRVELNNQLYFFVQKRVPYVAYFSPSLHLQSGHQAGKQCSSHGKLVDQDVLVFGMGAITHSA